MALLIFSLFFILAVYVVVYYFFKKYYRGSWKKFLGICILFFSLIGIFIGIFIRFYMLSPFVVFGEAMSPTYHNGDFLLINRLSKDFVRGDIVTFLDKKQSNTFFVHRIIGLPLEKVEIYGGHVFINGQVLNENYYRGETDGDISVILDQDQYFVLGDNRNESFDSRSFGYILKSSIVGKVSYKIPQLIQ